MKIFVFIDFFADLFAYVRKKQYFCSRFRKRVPKNPIRGPQKAQARGFWGERGPQRALLEWGDRAEARVACRLSVAVSTFATSEPNARGISSSGRAFRSQRRGREFESPMLHGEKKHRSRVVAMFFVGADRDDEKRRQGMPWIAERRQGMPSLRAAAILLGGRKWCRSCRRRGCRSGRCG